MVRQWEMVARDNQKENGRWYGHSLWLDRVSNRFSIRDMSGQTPDDTDDGPLWIDYDRPCVIFCDDVRRGSSPFRMDVPVIKERNFARSCVTYGGDDVQSWIKLLEITGRKAVMSNEVMHIVRFLNIIQRQALDLQSLEGVIV